MKGKILRAIKSIYRWVFILCLPILLLTASLAWGFNSQWMFNYGFKKFDVSVTTGLSAENLNKIAGSWTNYINSNYEFWDIVINQGGDSFTLFTREEQMHFKDVKGLVWLDYQVFGITLLWCLSYAFYCFRLRSKESYRRLAADAVIGSGISLGMILLLGAGSFLDFDALFLKMHTLIFTNDFWYAEGYMLNLFPGGFWYDAVFICMGLMAGLTIIVGGTGLSLLKLTGRIKNKDKLIL